MIFTRLGYVVAAIALLFGVFLLGVTTAIDFGYITPREDAIKRYFSGEPLGRVADRGMYCLIFGLALGILAEISSSLRRQARRDSNSRSLPLV